MSAICLALVLKTVIDFSQLIVFENCARVAIEHYDPATQLYSQPLYKLPDNIAEPIIEAIAGLELNPRPAGYIKLKRRKGYRIRTGNYRIIYEIFDNRLVVDVIALGHRRDIYD